MIQVTSTKDTGEKYFRVVIYGDSGVGKTLASSTFPAPILRLNLRTGEGGGDETLADQDIDTIQIDTYPEFVEAMVVLRGDYITTDPTIPEMAVPADMMNGFRGNKDVAKLIKNVQAKKYTTVVIDSFLGLQDLFIKQSKIHHGKDKGLKLFSDLRDLTKFWTEFIIHLPYNFCLITQKERIQDDDTNATYYVPAYPGKASQDIVNPRMTHILPIEVRPAVEEWAPGRNRWFMTQPDGHYTVKTRIPPGIQLPPYVAADFTRFITNLNERIQDNGGEKDVK